MKRIETLFTMRGATSVIVQTHQILRLPRKMTLQNFGQISRKQLKRHFHCGTDRSRIRAGSENETVVRNPPRNRGYFSRPPRAFCIEKYNLARSGYHSKFHRILRLPRKVTLELHQILRLPRKMTLMINPLHTWNVIYNARSNKCHCPNSPNTAPATKNDTWTSRNIAPATKNDLTEHWAMTWLSYDLTELWLDWAMTWLSYDLTELLLDWAMTWLSYYLTELLLDWAITWLSYDLTELLHDWAMTWLSYWAAISFVYRKFLN